jgi:hypothetical protein
MSVNALSPTMTVRDFENGYWYLEQLKANEGGTRAEAIAAWTAQGALTGAGGQ